MNATFPSSPSDSRNVPEVMLIGGQVPLGVRLSVYQKIPDGTVVYIIDGKSLRDHYDVGFTDAGHHYTEPYIPKGEIWLDRDAAGDHEYPFTLVNELTEYHAREDGEGAEAAAKRGLAAERKMRTRLQPPALTRVEQSYRGHFGQTEDGLNVWLVNGSMVRRSYNLDFIEGGHDKVYKFIPPDAVFIDDQVVPDERRAILLHELSERHSMASKGWPYERAHEEASRIEVLGRKNKGYLTQALGALGWST